MRSEGEKRAEEAEGATTNSKFTHSKLPYTLHPTPYTLSSLVTSH
ncbi:hypothetical protein [Chroococcidiopsis sp.]